MTILRANTIAGTGTTFGPLLDGNLEFNSQNYVILPKGTSSQEGVLRNTVDVVGTGGTYYDNLVLAMPFNEATGFTDVSSRNRNPATYGNVSIATTVSKYYGSSAKFDGNSIVRVAGIGSDFAFSDKNFTVEGYFRSNNAAATTIPIALTNLTVGGNSDAGWYIRFISSKIEGKSFSGSNEIGVTTYSSASNDTWYHVAYVRNGSTFTLYVDGTSVNTATSSGSLNHNPTWKVDVGHGYAGANYFDGYIQDVRVYQGIAKYTADFTPPDRIAEIGVGFKTGQLRYNTDSNKVELYDGNQWVEVQSSRPDLNGGARGVFGGGLSPTVTNVVQYVTISSTGNAIDFGDLQSPTYSQASASSSTRGLFGGGNTSPADTNRIDYITISSTGNAPDFGDLTRAHRNLGGCSNSTRGLFSGGYSAPTAVNIIDYVTIASQGVNAQDFGDLQGISEPNTGATASSTRGIIVAGLSPTTVTNRIDFVTISTLGNAADFGDVTVGRQAPVAISSVVRGVIAGGNTPSITNVIDYITIATLGNAADFGDLSAAKASLTGCSSSTRGVFGGGYTPTVTNVIEYITILSTGNAIDFGDLISPTTRFAACSNAHGGL